MSAPVVWILVPGLFAALLMPLRRWPRATGLAGVIATLLLAWLAWQLSIGVGYRIGPWSLKLDASLQVLGRSLTLTNADLAVLRSIYLLAAAWFAGAVLIRAGSLLVPIGLGILALLTATLAVEPFLFAALFLEVAVLLSVPMLATTGRPVGRGVVRLLTFQTIGTPFLLFTGWLLTGLEASPADSDAVIRASLLLGFGFALLLAIFPFHSWIPMVAEESEHYAGAFFFLLFTGVISYFGLGFFDRYLWLRNSAQVADLLNLAGLLMVLLGSGWAAIQKSLPRMLGYAVISEIGLVLLAAGLPQPAGRQIYFALVVPRTLGFLAWAAGLTLLKQRMVLTLTGVESGFWHFPWQAAFLVAGQLAIAGWPLMAGFPVRLALVHELASIRPVVALGVVAGMAGQLIATWRVFASMSRRPAEITTHDPTGGAEQLFILIAIVTLIVMGFLPFPG